MKNFALISTAGFAAVLVTSATMAQTVGIGTTKDGALVQITAAISKIVTTRSNVRMRPQPMVGAQQYFPIVNAGDLEFGASNMPQYWMGIKGIGLSKRKHPNLRIVANMMKIQVGLLTPTRANVLKPADIRGHKYPVRFKASPLIGLLSRAFLRNADLTEKDIIPVPVIGLRQQRKLLKQGEIDGATAAIGSADVQNLNASIPGGVRFVSLRDDAAARARVAAIYPKAWIEPIPPSTDLVGFDKPLNVLSYDYITWTHKGLSDEVVYTVVKAMYQNEARLKETSPLWRSHRSANMAKDHGPEAPYHPGAIKFYKEAGIWKR